MTKIIKYKKKSRINCHEDLKHRHIHRMMIHKFTKLTNTKNRHTFSDDRIVFSMFNSIFFLSDARHFSIIDIKTRLVKKNRK
jgi:hypothetical protein